MGIDKLHVTNPPTPVATPLLEERLEETRDLTNKKFVLQFAACL
jgi:hypothetical protein